MKRFQPAGAEIVRRIVEDEDEDDFSVKDVIDAGQNDFWYQIDGDASPWTWGGSWFNPSKNEIVHFDGIDQDGVKEVDPDEVEIPATMLAKLPPESEDWRENTERDRLIGNYQVARAEFLNNRVKHNFWRIHVCAPNDHIFRQYDDKIKGQFDPELAARYDEWPVQNKLIEIGRYIGFNEIGDQFSMSYLEAQQLLGSDKI